MPKRYIDTYLYNKYPAYARQTFEFIMGCDRINTKSEAFADIAYDIKRRNVSSALPKILMSKNVVIGINKSPLPKAFKVFVADDAKEMAGKPKVFIDVTDCVYLKDGVYYCKHIEWIIDYLVTAMNTYTYVMMEPRITSNQVIIKDGGEAFAKLFSYVLDRIYKTTTVQNLRKRIEYACALYYQANLLGKNFRDQRQFDTMRVVAMRIANIDRRDAQFVDIQIDEKAFTNIDTFLKDINRIFAFKDLETSAFIEMWMKVFGTGTIFAVEYYPAFAMMLTNAYLGGFIDQQLTIEKVAGQSMVTFTKKVIEIGAGVA